MDLNIELLKSLNLPIDIIAQEQIKECVYYIEGPSGQFILKLKKRINPNDSLAAKILTFFNISFRREIFINKQIVNSNFYYLKL